METTSKKPLPRWALNRLRETKGCYRGAAFLLKELHGINASRSNLRDWRRAGFLGVTLPAYLAEGISHYLSNESAIGEFVERCQGAARSRGVTDAFERWREPKEVASDEA